MLLFTERSLWTMLHGIGFGGAALLGLGAALFAVYLIWNSPLETAGAEARARAVARLTGVVAVTIWLTTIVGTYLVFPPYRATPPAGETVLTDYPRSLIMSSPETAWLHSFAMETKEHVPWIAAMLATAVAFVALRYGARLWNPGKLREFSTALLVICFVAVSYLSLLGVFVNKVAPLE